jgi:hypothetical protein
VPPTASITRAQILELMNKHAWTPQQVADALGVSKQAVNHHLHHTGGPRWVHPAKAARALLAQAITIADPVHTKSRPYRRLAEHAEYIQTGGRGMSRNKLVALRAWYKSLRDNGDVVVYDPSTGPRRGMRYGGWSYEPRTECDGSLIFRRNEHTHVDDEAIDIWRVPDEDLWPNVQKEGV